MSVNVDETEIHKFEKIADQWWDPQGSFKTLHEINPLRLDFIFQHCGHLAEKKILDVGCGAGILSEGLAKNGAKVKAIDMSEQAINVANEHKAELEIDYQQISVEDLAEQQPASFDIVTCMELLEHVPDPVSIVKACSQLVKPGGTVFLSTLNRNALSFLKAKIAAEYILKMLPIGTHDYMKFIKPSEMAAWLRDNELELKELQGIAYNPFNQTYKLDSKIDTNYLACAIKNET